MDIASKINELPEYLKDEAVDFIDFLIEKSKKYEQKLHPKAGFLKGAFTIMDDFDEPVKKKFEVGDCCVALCNKCYDKNKEKEIFLFTI